MLVKLKHQHKFRKHGLNLYCGCGETRRLLCQHKWEKTSIRSFASVFNPKCQHNEIEIICKICGEIRHYRTDAEGAIVEGNFNKQTKKANSTY